MAKRREDGVHSLRSMDRGIRLWALAVSALLLVPAGLATAGDGEGHLAVTNVRKVAPFLNDVSAPRLAGDLLAFVGRPAAGNATEYVYAMDVPSGSITRLSGPVNVVSLYLYDVDEGRVFWAKTTDHILHIWNASTNTTRDLPAPWTVGRTAFRIDGDWAVFVIPEPGRDQMVAYDFRNQTEFNVTGNETGHYPPSLYRGTVVWSEDRFGSDDVFAYDLATRAERRITFTPSIDESLPDIWMDTVVWEARNPATRDKNIESHDLRSNRTVSLTSGDRLDILPHVAGPFVGFLGHWPTTWSDAYVTDMDTGDVLQLTNTPVSDSWVAVSERHVAWYTYEDPHEVVYVADLSVEQPGPDLALPVIGVAVVLVVALGAGLGYRRRRKRARPDLGPGPP